MCLRIFLLFAVIQPQNLILFQSEAKEAFVPNIIGYIFDHCLIRIK